MTDEQAHDALILHLQREINGMRETRWNEYYKIAMNGILSAGYYKMNGMSDTDYARDAAGIADAMEVIADER